MKFIFNLTLISISIFFIGCTKNQPIVKGYENTRVAIAGSYSLDDGDVSEVNNLAIFIHQAALMFKEHDLKYFYIVDQDIPEILTNFDDLISYCYPDNGGYSASDFEDKSTSLERKCLDLKIYKHNDAFYFKDENKVALKLQGTNELTFDQPVWVVEDVLKDDSIKKYITEAKTATDNAPLEFKEKYTTALLKMYSSKNDRVQYMKSPLFD